MAKRVAEKQLTLENFEDDDDDDDGSDDQSDSVPQIASKEVLQNRPLAKARRRSDLNAGGSESTETKSPFSSFTGFKGFDSKSLVNTNTSSVMAFKSLPQTQTNDTINSLSLKSSTQTNGSRIETFDNADSLATDADDVYHKKLSQLNECFIKHIKKYMDKSVCYDFTQVCKEYIEYHKSIEHPLPEDKEDTTLTNNMTSDSVANSTITEFQSQQSFATTTSTPLSSQASAVQSSQSSTDESLFAKPKIQFSLKPFTNTNNSNVTETTETTEEDNKANDGEDNEHPPKVESVQHHEPNAVLSKKCKLFFKKDDRYVEKGKGSLYIKKEVNATNAQLLIRADTKLGNVLLNISLVESLPISKANNKKDIFLTCIPNPPLEPKAPKTQTPVTFLIRVNPNDLEEVYKNLTQYQSLPTV